MPVFQLIYHTSATYEPRKIYNVTGLGRVGIDPDPSEPLARRKR